MPTKKTTTKAAPTAKSAREATSKIKAAPVSATKKATVTKPQSSIKSTRSTKNIIAKTLAKKVKSVQPKSEKTLGEPVATKSKPISSKKTEASASKAKATPAAKPAAKSVSKPTAKPAVKPDSQTTKTLTSTEPVHKLPPVAEPTPDPIQPVSTIPELKPHANSTSRTSTRPSSRKKTKKEAHPLTEAELVEYRENMIELRSRLTKQVDELQEQSLLRHDEVNQEEDGGDEFERLISLDRARADQGQINQINAAIQAIDNGTYGLCEVCNGRIERPRLKALPFIKTCIQCQAEKEGFKNHGRPSVDLFD